METFSLSRADFMLLLSSVPACVCLSVETIFGSALPPDSFGKVCSHFFLPEKTVKTSSVIEHL